MGDDNFRIIIIDDNTEIHNDFLKILTSKKSSISKISELAGLKNILFEEDEESITLPEFEIDTATQGKEGFARIMEAYNAGKPYALAFVDIRMPPGWDGIETIKHIWSVDKDIQIVICTAYSDYTWEETVARLGKNDNLLILKKPFDYIAVRQLAYALTHKWRLMQNERAYRLVLEDRVKERTHSLEKSLSITRATLESSADGIMVIDIAGNVIDFNNKFISMWNIPTNTIASKLAKKIFDYLDEQIIQPKNFFSSFNNSEILEKIIMDTLILNADRIFECYSQPHQLNNNIIGRVWSFRDITKRAMLEKRLQHQATHDSLTGLPNRVFLIEKIEQTILSSKHDGKHFAILFFDLDRFKLVNDSLSHEAGDELLQAVAARINQMIRPEDIFARLSGDEFILLIPNLSNPEHAVVEIAQQLIKKIHDPFLIKGRVITISMSIGVSIYPKDGETVSDLLKNADSAMYHAKESGSDQFQLYDSTLNDEIKEHFEFELALRNAIRENQFELFYQPQFNLEENKIIAVEALIRWNHPQKGVLLPIEFIPFAESVGLIIPIGEWVLRHACKQLKAWHDAKYPKIRVAVNITSQQLRQFKIVDTIKNILDEFDLAPEYLELELTENSIINNPTIIESLNNLKRIGISIALDDFGSGYSTLNYLRNLSLDRLKIDRSFVQNILINRGDEAIIQAIIDMAKGFNLEVLAEGVENEKQLQFLKDKKVGAIQGFYFSQPLDVNAVERFLKNEIDMNELFSLIK